MTLQAQWTLTYDNDFVSRGRACMTNQATVYVNDLRPPFVSLSNSFLKLDAIGNQAINTFMSLLGAAPGFADEADNGDGTVDSSKIQDGEILSAVQAGWAEVANLYFDEDGNPKT